MLFDLTSFSQTGSWSLGEGRVTFPRPQSASAGRAGLGQLRKIVPEDASAFTDGCPGVSSERHPDSMDS